MVITCTIRLERNRYDVPFFTSTYLKVTVIQLGYRKLHQHMIRTLAEFDMYQTGLRAGLRQIGIMNAQE